MKSIINIIVIISAIFAAYFYIEKESVLAGDVKQLKESISYIQLEFQRSSKEERLFKIADRFECEDYAFKNCGITIPKTVREEVIRLQKEILDIDLRIQKIEAK